MKQICIVCEGTTETEFVNQCLIPHLISHNISLHARILQSPSGNHRGGRVTVERLARHISHEYSSYDRITTLVDFYGFQDRNGRDRATIEAAVLNEVKKISKNIDPRFVFPYVQMHEFEGLLFTDIDAFEWVQDGWSNRVQKELQDITKQFASPEDINDSPHTAPSKRIEKIFPEGSYSKTEHGPLIIEAIGIDKIREKCPAFNEWIEKLISWGKE